MSPIVGNSVEGECDSALKPNTILRADRRSHDFADGVSTAASLGQERVPTADSERDQDLATV